MNRNTLSLLCILVISIYLSPSQISAELIILKKNGQTIKVPVKKSEVSKLIWSENQIDEKDQRKQDMIISPSGTTNSSLPWFKWKKIREINGKKVTRYELVLHNFRGQKFWKLPIDYSLWKNKSEKPEFYETHNELGYHWLPAYGGFETSKTYSWYIKAGMINKAGNSYEEWVYDGPVSFTIGSTSSDTGSEEDDVAPKSEEMTSDEKVFSSVVGQWQWADRQHVIIKANGTFLMDGRPGRWEQTGPSDYTFANADGYTAVLRLTNSGKVLTGHGYKNSNPKKKWSMKCVRKE